MPPFYDSLLGKIIAHGRDRAQALARLRAAIAVTRIEGVASNLALHADVLADPEFVAGGVDTGYLARLLERAYAQVRRQPWLTSGWSKPRCATATSACGRRWASTPHAP